MVEEMAEIMEYCQKKAKEAKNTRLATTDFHNKNIYAAYETAYEEIANLARESLVRGGYLEQDE